MELRRNIMVPPKKHGSRNDKSPVGVREDDYKDRAAKVIVAAMEAAEKDMEAYCREHDEKCHLGSLFVQDYVPAIASSTCSTLRSRPTRTAILPSASCARATFAIPSGIPATSAATFR